MVTLFYQYNDASFKYPDPDPVAAYLVTFHSVSSAVYEQFGIVFSVKLLI